MIETLLVANRGEIAVRVLRTARRLGLRTIAVYSDADRDALHVQMADEAVRLGPAPARDSYLRGDLILAAAARFGAQAIHPGYGFLSENAEFAQACADAGICFVGPPAAAIRAMGSKSESKRIMAGAGVPLVAGYHDSDQSDAMLTEAAARIGWPVLVKASAGGGGKGMRIVTAAAELKDALIGARREAGAAFGDDTLLLEKYLQRPRHVEVQVFADTHGACVSLFDRDCSLQRRHQKIIEEAPAPGLSNDLRQRMSAAAIAAARAVGYVGAGTVEFMVEGGEFYFIEMNTRLQVEHPVTEMVTGLDLVEWQLRVAAGDALPVADIPRIPQGHAFEVRIYAEDPGRDFLPSSGVLSVLREPGIGADCRIDSGVREGDAISVYYDPLIAKLIVHGENRSEALQRLRDALSGYAIAGLTTNLALLAAIAAHPAFAAAQIETGFIERFRPQLLPAAPEGREDAALLAALGVIAAERKSRQAQAAASDDPFSPWNAMDAWQSHLPGTVNLRLRDEQGMEDIAIDMRRDDKGVQAELVLTLPNSAPRLAQDLHVVDHQLTCTLGGRRRQAIVRIDGAAIEVVHALRRWRWLRDDLTARQAGAAAASGAVLAPMPGTIVDVLVTEGESVKRGAPLLIVEAMKMEHTLRAPCDGIVTALICQRGAKVQDGMTLLQVEAAK